MTKGEQFRLSPAQIAKVFQINFPLKDIKTTQGFAENATSFYRELGMDGHWAMGLILERIIHPSLLVLAVAAPAFASVRGCLADAWRRHRPEADRSGPSHVAEQTGFFFRASTPIFAVPDSSGYGDKRGRNKPIGPGGGTRRLHQMPVRAKDG